MSQISMNELDSSLTQYDYELWSLLAMLFLGHPHMLASNKKLYNKKISRQWCIKHLRDDNTLLYNSINISNLEKC